MQRRELRKVLYKTGIKDQAGMVWGKECGERVIEDYFNIENWESIIFTSILEKLETS